jgi:hypothetical protein
VSCLALKEEPLGLHSEIFRPRGVGVEGRIPVSLYHIQVHFKTKSYRAPVKPLVLLKSSNL